MRVIEEGIVNSVSNDSADIVMSQGDSSACVNCGLCAKNKNARVITLDVAAFPGIAVGNRVRIEIDTPSTYLAMWLMFAQPLLLLIVGIFAGIQIGEAILGPSLKGLAGFGLPVILVAANYLIVAWLERRVFSLRRARAKVVEIIE
jgi:positive regulator of sigma E activity